MQTSDRTCNTAAEKITKAIIDVQGRVEEKNRRFVRQSKIPAQPFFAHLLMNMEFREMPKWFPMQTVGVDAVGHCFYNEEWVMGLNSEEVAGTVVHETLHCLEPGTVVTDKVVEDVEERDGVVCADGELHGVGRVMTRKHKGEIMYVKPRGCLPLRITPNHRMLAMKSSGWEQDAEQYGRGVRRNKRVVSKPDWIEAGKLTTEHYLLVPKLKSNKGFAGYVLPVSDEIEGNDWSVRARDCTLNEDVAFVLGRFTADGWTSKTETSSEVGFIFNIRKEADADRVVRVLKVNFGLAARKVWDKLNSHVEQPEGVWRVFVGSQVLKRFLRRHIGTYAHNKCIPQWIMQHPDMGVVKGYLAGLLGGDGWLNKKGGANDSIGYCTVSKVLAVQVQSLLTRLNAFGRIYERDGGVCELSGGGGECRDQYIVQCVDKVLFDVLGFEYSKVRSTKWHIDLGESFAVKVTELRRDVYDGKVYNFSTKPQNYTANNIVVHNCACLHLLRLGARNPQMANIAMDMVVNMMVIRAGYRLPKDTVKVDTNADTAEFAVGPVKFKVLQVGEKIWEQIYDELIQQAKKQGMQVSSNSMSGKGSKDGKGSGIPGFDEHIYGDGTKAGEGKDGKDAPADGSGLHDNGNVTLTPGQMEDLRNKWQKEICDAAAYAKQKGNLPLGIDRLIGKLLEPKVPWDAVLRNYLAPYLSPVDWTFNRMHRKSQQLEVVMPALLREHIQIGVVVDTSGSIDQENMTEFLSEMVGMAQALRHVEMQVAFVDAAVQATYAVDNGEIDKILAMKPKGGGGTSMEVGLDYMKDKFPELAVVITITDGYDTYIHKAEDYPFDVIWCISKGGQAQMPYGEKIKMEA